MIQIVTLETDKAERLMKALCNHFARKITARYEGDKGYIEFGDAKCEITVTSNEMEFRADADTPEGLEHAKGAISNHLQRFIPDDSIQINWRDPA